MAVQGPRVKEFINDCVKGASISAARVERATDLRKNQIGEFHFEHGGVLVSRTGYTGEDGFEIVGSDKAIQQAWDKILAAGRSFGLKPCGLGARDTLRTEVCYPLYGHELDENTTPMEAGLGFFVSLDKGEFHRARDFGGTKSQRRREKIGCLQNERKIRATAAALSDLGERCQGWRRHQWHAKPVVGHRHRDGLRAAGIGQTGHGD